MLSSIFLLSHQSLNVYENSKIMHCVINVLLAYQIERIQDRLYNTKPGNSIL